MNKIKIGFPQMGNYSIPAKFLFKRILHGEIIDIPNITNKTLELGSKCSPDFVCTPFKYTIGTLIECLDAGADVVIQAGGGCRYGYYSELQEEILKDLGYKFTFINLVSCGKIDLKKIYHSLKKVDKKFNILKGLYYLFISSKMVKYMDLVDDYIRLNIGFEAEKGMLEKLNNEMLISFSNAKCYLHLRYLYKKYLKKIKSVVINKPDDYLKVGVIGELYTLMEPFANYYLEKELASYNISVKRYTNAHYLLFEKGKRVKKYLKESKNYIKYKMGADAHDNIARTLELCNNDYDGIIHIKSSFCTPEIGAMPIVDKICKERNKPVIFLSFDTNTSSVGVKTRLEAFKDMIEMRMGK